MKVTLDLITFMLLVDSKNPRENKSITRKKDLPGHLKSLDEDTKSRKHLSCDVIANNTFSLPDFGLQTDSVSQQMIPKGLL